MTDFDRWWSANRDWFDVDESVARSIWCDGYRKAEEDAREYKEAVKRWHQSTDPTGA